MAYGPLPSRPPRDSSPSEWPEVDIYARKSAVLAKGDRLREVSTDEQIRQGRAWAAREGYRVRNVWVELGSAYADRERPKFNAAVNAVVSGEVPVLWVYMLDRFTRRGAEDVLKILGKGRVVFDYDRLDSADDRDRERIIMEAERARAFSVRLSHRVRDVKANLRDQGFWIGGATPWGVTIDPNTHRTVADHSPSGGHGVLTKAQKGIEAGIRLRGGESARAIVRGMNTLEIPGPRGGLWYPKALLRVVLSPVYAGYQVDHRGDDPTGIYRNERGHPVRIGEELISIADQNKIKESLRAAIPQKHGRTAPGKSRHMLTGILRCAGSLSGVRTHNMNSRGESYVCSLIIHGHDCPERATAGRAAIERYVSEKWLHVVSSLEPTDPLAHVIAERWAALQAPDQTTEHQEALAALEAAKTVRLRLQRAYRLGAYEGADAMFAEEMREATRAVQEAQTTVSQHVAPVPDLGFVDDPDTLREAWKNSTVSRKRQLLRLAIRHVWVTRSPHRGGRFKGDERVVIEWADAT